MLLSRYKNGLMVALGVGVISLLPLYYAVWWGFCQGWLFGGSYLLRSAWLCSCPIPKETEQTFYPDHIEVVFSACDNVDITEILPSGEYILVENDPQEPHRYLWNPLTNDKLPFPMFGPNDKYNLYAFLTPEIVWASPKISDPTTNDIVLMHWSTNTSLPQVSEKFILEAEFQNQFKTLIASGEYDIYVYKDKHKNLILRISLVPKNFPLTENNLSYTFIVEEDTKVQNEAVQSLINSQYSFYIRFNGGHPDDFSSPNVQFMANVLGVYEIGTNKLLADVSTISTSGNIHSACVLIIWCTVAYKPCCWQADNQAVFYEYSGLNGAFQSITPYSIGTPWGFNGEVVTPIFRVHLPSSTP